jgi:DnaJ-class molecular chaperone
MNATDQETIANRCEACFGKGTITLMKPIRFGQPIDTSLPPVCRVCKGTGKKSEAT